MTTGAPPPPSDAKRWHYKNDGKDSKVTKNGGFSSSLALLPSFILLLAQENIIGRCGVRNRVILIRPRNLSEVVIE
jgi:hypothetical protein